MGETSHSRVEVDDTSGSWYQAVFVILLDLILMRIGNLMFFACALVDGQQTHDTC